MRSKTPQGESAWLNLYSPACSLAPRRIALTNRNCHGYRITPFLASSSAMAWVDVPFSKSMNASWLKPLYGE